MSDWRVIHGDVLESLRAMEAGSVQTCVTSPPYWGLRDYGHAGQIGLEKSPAEYVAKMVEVFGEVRRVLREDGTLWLNLGDSYAAPNGRSGGGTCERGPNSALKHMHESQEVGAVRSWGDLPAKNLVGIPWRVALALQADGWYLRQDIIWHKPNPMPESVTDRCTKAHEYIFLLAKSERYHFDAEAIKEDAADSSLARWNQDIESQAGSDRATGGAKTNGAMKAVGGPKRWPAIGSAKYTEAGSDGPYSGNVIDAKPIRNRRSVWTVSPAQFSEAHFATFPPKLIEPCILAGAPEGGTVLDPFNGSGTTGLVCIKHQRRYVGIELNSECVAMSERRLSAAAAQGVLFAANGGTQ
jgi:DNA modification methylase